MSAEIESGTLPAEPEKHRSPWRTVGHVLAFPFRIFERIIHGIAYLVVIALILVGMANGLFNWWASAPMEIAPETVDGILPPQGMSLKVLLDDAEAQPCMQGFRTYAMKYIAPAAILNVLSAQGYDPGGPEAESLQKSLPFPVPWDEIKGSLGNKIRATRYFADNLAWRMYVRSTQAAGCFDLGGTGTPVNNTKPANGG